MEHQFLIPTVVAILNSELDRTALARNASRRVEHKESLNLSLLDSECTWANLQTLTLMISPTIRLFATSFLLTTLAGAAPMVVVEGGQALWAVLSHPFQAPRQTPAWQFHRERTQTAAIALGISVGILGIAWRPQARQAGRVTLHASRQLPWRSLWPAAVGVSFWVGFWSMTDRQALQQAWQPSRWQPAVNRAWKATVQQVGPASAVANQWLKQTGQEFAQTSEVAWQHLSQQTQTQWQAWQRER